MNKRITKREQGLLKGSLRRVFARSDLHRQVLDAAEVIHSDPKRPRVKRWCLCAVCLKPEARSYCAVDHFYPIVAIDSTFESQGLDKTADNLWCDINQLQCICPTCHDEKTKAENRLRRENKKCLTKISS